MVDRPIVLVGELPCVEDVLGGWKDTMFGLGFMAQAAIGPNTGVSGFALSPTGPASLSVIVGAGSIYSVETADATAYGVLGTDATSIVKQGLLTVPVTLTVTPPTTSGFSQVYIVQVDYDDVDTGTTLVPFFNSANPSAPSSSTENTIRQGQAVIELKAGTAAPTGSQTTPAPDAGFTALWAITVANGATTVTSANWQQLSVNGSPFGAPWFPNLESLFSLFQQVFSVNTTFQVNNAIGNDATGNGSVQFPWASIAHAVSVISTFNLGGNSITIQLGTTGVNYIAPPTISAPSNGTLIIRGNEAAQSSIAIQGSPPNGSGVITVNSGTVNLVGLTLINNNAAGYCLIGINNSQVNLQNVSFETNVIGSQALIAASAGGSVGVGSGCIMGGDAVNMWAAFDGGSIIQAANVAMASTPAYSSSTVAAFNCGVISVTVTGLSFTGTGAVGSRFSATANGVITTGGGGANFYPGNSAGTTATGGQSL
jgi:hypothetical protein